MHVLGCWYLAHPVVHACESKACALVARMRSLKILPNDVGNAELVAMPVLQVRGKWKQIAGAHRPVS
jgi:hypothetical protein